ncbi:MAG: hypothetical protein C0483_18735 [Pirellula sp.]|nr:hypothetical protein [Pirellula sp.]
MSLAVGDLCTVVYADGGVRVALPVTIAGNGERAFLADFGISGTGVPVRTLSIDEVAATVPEAEHDPRLQRVVGTLARDANGVALFVPLGVLPASTPEPTPGSTFFIVFADTCNVDAVDENGVAAFSFYRRKPGEFDLLVSTYPDGSFFRGYATDAISFYFNIPGVIIEGFNMPHITIREQTYEWDPTRITSDRTNSFNVSPGARRTVPLLNVGVATVKAAPDTIYRIFLTYTSPEPIGAYPGSRVITSEINWISDDYYFPDVITRLRENLAEWPDLPPAIVYHLPLAADARPGTLNEILPQGVTDTSPLDIIRGGYPSVADVVARIAAHSSEEGVREVRFFTAMATVGGVNRINAFIAEVVTALEASYGQVLHSISVAPNYDWLGALADSAAQLPDA